MGSWTMYEEKMGKGKSYFFLDFTNERLGENLYQLLRVFLRMGMGLSWNESIKYQFSLQVKPEKWMWDSLALWSNQMRNGMIEDTIIQENDFSPLFWKRIWPETRTTTMCYFRPFSFWSDWKYVEPKLLMRNNVWELLRLVVENGSGQPVKN